MSLLILIAEDDPGVRMAVQGYLETFGYSVIMAEDGEQALSMIQHYRPHLLISDINMPKKNGYELVREIRKFPEFRLLPVIFLTEYDQVTDRVQGYKVGCDVYLAKPFEVEELEAVIRNLLERSQIIGTELIVANNQERNLASNTEEITQEPSAENEVQLNLTDKEQQVLVFVVEGFSNIKIGKELHLSHRTIEKYVSRLLRKTDTKNRAELIRFALENHLL
ncbi:Response regulator containing a CheY-like receiver domain and an HTH DNA-binding domain [Hyella patelloides LEGE 07179]|uniref:Response regulator containing a CheY-like receiver domain and an HTH DNA-binding domain n=1 Tax=Hyella patelloides LEGE 07179 TaxID=945734 RepID=A0A563VTX6_9CYAN|nr:response regulator transcription factor [Hyella patelloides]VEP14721.1 Response regulator containing a CheY-like receiver domain and an HTH DNA-binding domain [Hyella patelloides LEGE 07179]